MKKQTLLSLALGVSILFTQAQDKKLDIPIHTNSNKVLYLDLIPTQSSAKYFLSANDADNKKLFESKSNCITVYGKWLNPLRYSFSWKDSLKADPNEKLVGDYLTSMMVPFSSSFPNAPKSFVGATSTGSSKVLPGNTRGIDLKTTAQISNPSIVTLYYLLNEQPDSVGVDTVLLNKLQRHIADLNKLDGENHRKTMNDAFKSLLNANTPKQAADAVNAQRIAIKDFADDFVAIERLIERIADISNDFTFSRLKKVTTKTENGKQVETVIINKKLESLLAVFKATFFDFVTANRQKVAANKLSFEKLKPIIAAMEASLEDESANTLAKGYFPLRQVDFEDGRILQTELTISEHVYNDETFEFKNKNEGMKKGFIFRRYDGVKVSVSTGIFYGTATLRTFGVAGNGSFTVSETTIKKEKAIAAAFLNFTFDLFNSRYLAPELQLGVDPTKKHPFILAGGGFSVLDRRFAITGGPMWTWEAKLNNLTVGGPVASTSVLESDITYEFTAKPKGFYLGIQYNF